MLYRITTKTIISLILINFLSVAFADDKDAIWITPSSTDYSRLATGLAGSNISIITSEEIAASKHKAIPELLSTYSGIQIRKSYSNVDSSSTSLDMRGFGESSTNNVMILLNGRRLNDIDMAGVDFSSIPHETIERIEIVRGGSAATIYGDGAVGGAINVTDAATTRNNLGIYTGIATKPIGGAGTLVTVINSNVLTTSKIMITILNDPGNAAIFYIGTIIDNTSFVIISREGNFNITNISYLIIN